jgi:hypothetical protein
MSDSDISDEDAILPAVGILDDLDSDVSFSDDDPALQDYSDRSPAARAADFSAAGQAAAADAPAPVSDYSVKEPFWAKARGGDEAARNNNNLSRAEQEAVSARSRARDDAIVQGKFIPCPRFTVSRDGYEFRVAGDLGTGYYLVAESQQDLPSAWPRACDGVLRIGLYKCSV